ncbi:FAD-dependent oxidoreductase [Amycolatopsis nigrescens]|uniref:FAD-dependent oxidoreductase n=1 Tax=Amycolatopsis nigrescens TaxID=381445 RepID=UPI00037D21E7|nr:NAD(P)/FAD-dependent oxidoreductase [Amycolatopsis nigrescens]
MRVLIAGAGLGGLCLAQGLRQAGIDVAVFEQDSSPRSRAQGHRVHIDHRGDDALRTCLPAPLYQLYLETRGQRNERFQVLSAAGGLLREVPVPGPAAEAVINPGWAVSRLTLREILLAGMDNIVHFGQTVHSFESGAQVRVHFRGGGSATGDLLVGADGIGSVVRRQYLPDAELRDTGIRWIGGKSPITPESDAALPTTLGGSFAAITGNDPAMGIGYLRFTNDPRATADRLWPGLRLTDQTDFVMWAITIAADRLPGGDAALSTMESAALHRHAVELTRHSHPGLRTIVGQGWPAHTFFLRMGTSVPTAGWRPSNVTLLGDAIHAMPPAKGSGANTALADAGTLTRSLHSVRHQGKPLLTAVGDYEREMTDRGFQAVRASTDVLDSVAQGLINGTVPD